MPSKRPLSKMKKLRLMLNQLEMQHKLKNKMVLEMKKIRIRLEK